MALFGMQMKSRRKANAIGFNADYQNDRTALRQRKQLGYTRSILSAASLLFGGAMFYVALHYIPAFAQPRQILKFASGDSPALETYEFDRKSKVHEVFGPFIQLFHLDRAYMKPGQSIHVKYDLPKGAYANLDIIQCQRVWVFEIFNCTVTGKYSAKTKLQRGIESFALEDGGFYHFRHHVINVPEGEPYRILWERAQ